MPAASMIKQPALPVPANRTARHLVFIVDDDLPKIECRGHTPKQVFGVCKKNVNSYLSVNRYPVKRLESV
jgi:hypothetical protein